MRSRDYRRMWHGSTDFVFQPTNWSYTVYARDVEQQSGAKAVTELRLTKMQTGQTGKVTRVHGGHGFRRRLEAMGIRPGMRVTKVSGQIMRGPIIVKIGQSQIAIGFGMAHRVFVEV